MRASLASVSICYRSMGEPGLVVGREAGLVVGREVLARVES